MDIIFRKNIFLIRKKIGALPEEASLHTVEMAAIKVASKEIFKKLVIYTYSQSSMQSYKFKKEALQILSQIYDIKAKLQIQGKNIILFKVTAQIGIKENDKTGKQAGHQDG